MQEATSEGILKCSGTSVPPLDGLPTDAALSQVLSQLPACIYASSNLSPSNIPAFKTLLSFRPTFQPFHNPRHRSKCQSGQWFSKNREYNRGDSSKVGQRCSNLPRGGTEKQKDMSSHQIPLPPPSDRPHFFPKAHRCKRKTRPYCEKMWWLLKTETSNRVDTGRARAEGQENGDAD